MYMRKRFLTFLVAGIMATTVFATDLNVNVNITNKKAVVTGDICVRETVDVVITNYGSYSPTNLLMGIIEDTNLLAASSGFTLVDGAAFGEISLNTSNLVEVFRNSRIGRSDKKFDLIIWDTQENSLLVNMPVSILNNPYTTNMISPIGLNTWAEADLRYSDFTIFAGSATTGLVASAAADAAKFLRGDGTWQIIPGGGDMLVATYDTNGVAQDIFTYADNLVTNSSDWDAGWTWIEAYSNSVLQMIETTSSWIQAATDASGWTNWANTYTSIVANIDAATNTYYDYAQLTNKSTLKDDMTNASTGYPFLDTNYTDDVAVTGNYKVFYSDGSGVFTELGFGAANTYLRSSGVAAAPAWSFVSPSVGIGDITGTVVNTTMPVSNGTNLVMRLPGFVRTNLGVVIGTDVQAWDDDLDDIAAASPSNTHVLSGDGTNWTSILLITAIKAVDGAGSGLDADLLDGAGADQFIQFDTEFTGDLWFNGKVATNIGSLHASNMYVSVILDMMTNGVVTNAHYYGNGAGLTNIPYAGLNFTNWAGSFQTYQASELLARTNHTGVQAAATIGDFTVAVTSNTEVAANTVHRGSDGSDHTFIDQSVVSGASPTFDGANFTGIPTNALDDGVYNLTSTNALKLENQDSAYHLARTNHTGVQAAATIGDFDEEVTNNTEVALNTVHRGSDGSDHSLVNDLTGGTNYYVYTNDSRDLFFTGDVTVPVEAASSNSVVAREFLENALSQYQTFYFQASVTSDVSGYYFMDTVPNQSNETTITVSAPTQGQYVASFCTTSGVPGITEIQTGVYTIYAFLEKDGAKAITVKAEGYLLDSAGNIKFEIENTPSNNIIDNKALYRFQIVMPTNAAQLTTDRWAARLKVTSVGSPAPDLYIYTEGASESFLQGSVGEGIGGDVFTDQDNTFDADKVQDIPLIKNGTGTSTNIQQTLTSDTNELATAAAIVTYVDNATNTAIVYSTNTAYTIASTMTNTVTIYATNTAYTIAASMTNSAVVYSTNTAYTIAAAMTNSAVEYSTNTAYSIASTMTNTTTLYCTNTAYTIAASMTNTLHDWVVAQAYHDGGGLTNVAGLATNAPSANQVLKFTTGTGYRWAADDDSAGSDWWTNAPDTAILVATNSHTADYLLKSADGTNLYWAADGGGGGASSTSVCFRVYCATNWDIGASASVKVPIDTELFDPGADYDLAGNNRFDCPNDGIYVFNASYENSSADAQMSCEVWTNGVSAGRMAIYSGNNATRSLSLGPIWLPSGVYVEFYSVDLAGAAEAGVGGQEKNWFTGYQLR